MIVATTLFDHPHIKGIVEFEEKGTKVVIKGNLKSTKYKNSSHGIHIHEAGDLSEKCMGACAKFRMEDSLVKLRGTKANVIGRSVVIHEDMDDLGMGNHNDSLTTGHAGKRITCAVIGYSKRNFLP